MTPTEAAARMAALEAAGDIREAIRFAHAYENDASEEDFDAYLDARFNALKQSWLVREGE